MMIQPQSSPKNLQSRPIGAPKAAEPEQALDSVVLGVNSEPQPLPLSTVASSRTLAGRIPVELSPDGELIAFTVLVSDRVQGDQYTPSGVPLTEGRVRRQLELRQASSGEAVSLGEQGNNAWAPIWSPDGKKLAYFSDKDGFAQAWVWDRESGESRAVGSFVARPNYGFETMSWNPDGTKLLVESKPEDEPISRSREQTMAAVEKDPLAWASRSDLLLVDIETEEIKVLAEDIRSRKYSISPDGKKVAFTHLEAVCAESQGQLRSCHIVNLESGEQFQLADNLSLRYGPEWEWSPNSDAIAFVTDKKDGGRLLLADLNSRELRQLGKNAPNLDARFNGGMKAPVWDPKGEKIFVSDDEKIWSFQVDSGEARVAAESTGWSIHSLARTSFYSGPWGGDGKALLVGRRPGETGVWRFDPRSGEVSKLATIDKEFSVGQASLRSSPDGKHLFLNGGGDRENRSELYRFDTISGTSTQLSQFSDKIEGGKGETRVVSWQTDEGKELKGSLLLPPGYDGRPLPTVTFVYGGSDGTSTIDQYGFAGHGGGMFDAHVLSTRGYAVFVPSTPFAAKSWLNDVSEAVISGVDALVEQGYADPDRLALMGQSFGSLNAWGVLTRTDMFEAAVTTANVLHPDLTVGFQENPGYYQGGQIKMIDTPEEDPDAYAANSPIHDFENITTPLLMIQGTEDGVEVAKFTADILKKAGKDVELKIYEDEGHVIQSPENIVDVWERRLKFLEKHMPERADLPYHSSASDHSSQNRK